MEFLIANFKISFIIFYVILNTDMNKVCLVCGLSFEKSEYEPFCSLRCKNIDLHMWLSELYTIEDEKSKKKLDD